MIDSASRVKSRLFVASSLMLFTEIALIRWLGENVLYLSYFTNFILLASFLGIGIGFLRADRDLGWFNWSGHLLLALIGFVTVFPVGIDRSAEEVLFLGTGSTKGLPVWVMLPIVFVMTASVLAAIGHGVGRLFKQLEPLSAYRFDILGSIAGVLVFGGMSLLRAPPLAWAAVIAALFLWLLGSRRQGTHLVVCLGVLLILGIQTFDSHNRWSPYYRITTVERDETISIAANSIPHQLVGSVDLLKRFHTIAVSTFELIGLEDPGEVLIIGAGTGNDVALALDVGAQHVDAVEIDPVIYETGVELHPDHPYQQTDRVTAHIDDGRAFLQRSSDSYDFILFALTDSLTLVSGQSSLRLESYLFTKESMEAAKERLKGGGVLALYNLHSDQWVIDRMGRTMQEVFGQEPCYQQGAGTVGVTLAVGAVQDRCPASAIQDFSTGPDSSTDDYPFLYVQERGLPPIYLAAITAILLASIAAIRIGVGRLTGIRLYLDLFVMGAAFLLLETMGVVRFALWFGTTWVVNAIVFTSILVSVLLAIEVVERFKVPSFRVLYSILGVTLLGAWLVPAGSLLELDYVPRLVAAAAITFAPVFVANVIFAERFKDVGSSTSAFGANLLGAMVGGILEYLALVVGYRSLILLVAVLYGVAFVLLGRLTRQGHDALTRLPAESFG